MLNFSIEDTLGATLAYTHVKMSTGEGFNTNLADPLDMQYE